MTRILCLDLATQTGWALAQHVAGQLSITSGTQSFHAGRFEGAGMRFLKFHRWLEDMHLLSGGVTTIYFEEVRRHASTDAAHAYGGFMGKLTEWCELRGVPYQGVPVQTIKKHLTHKGNASKKEVIDAVKAKGHTPQDDNEADALALLYWSLVHAPTASPARVGPAPNPIGRRRA